jgi:hypothetical protein
MNMLWSYAYARTRPLGEDVASLGVEQLRFFADSGAHSARTLGIHLGVDDYAKWLLKWRHLFTVYANLDVIGAPQATRDNQTYLEQEHGLNPMPVFHTGEPFDVLARYLEEGYTYIALGKLLGIGPSVLHPWLDQCFKMAHGAAVFHGFGMTKWPTLKRYPWFTTDSSTWGAGYRHGRVVLFGRNKWLTVDLRDPLDTIHRYRDVIDTYGVPYAMFSRSGQTRDLLGSVSAASYYRAAAWLRELHGPVALPPGKGYPPNPPDPILPAAEPGLAIYLADTTITAHKIHAAAITGGMA